jgi:carboxypeptidase Q
MQRPYLALLSGLALGVPWTIAAAQSFPTDEPVMRRIWTEGMEHSQLYPLAQVLLDSVGPRLTGAPGQLAANDWAVGVLRSWGIEAQNEQYGTWMGWRRGTSHLDLLQPRIRSLEGQMLAWSPGTRGKAVRGGVVILPDVPDDASFQAWLPQVKGKFVLVSYAQPTCRPDANWEEFGAPGSFDRMRAARDSLQRGWRSRGRFGPEGGDLHRRLEDAGAIGIVTSSWSGGWGVNRVFSATTQKAPTFDLSCEDYGLVFRLAENGQGPVLQAVADAEFTGEAPLYNTIGVIPGTEKPDEYVVLSAHFDSWDGGSGATDNGTGSITMLEAMRILKAVYPSPKRTIVVGLWASEEQGLNGSRAFARDHPDIVEGMQALFNQDNGTGRVVRISMSGLTGAAEFFGRWFGALPQELTADVDLTIPGTPSGGGTDHASFICAGAPAFGLGSLGWDYSRYTWHTQRDTFDKLVFDDLKNNATLTAMLAYLASEEPGRIPRDRRVLPVSPRTGEQMTWPECREPMRTWEGYRGR